MTKNILLAMGILCVMFLTACGGGSGINHISTDSYFDNTKASLNVQSDKMTYQPAMLGGVFAHLSDGTKEVSVDKKNVKKILWNGPMVGWHVADSSKGVDLQYNGSDNPTLTIPGQPLSSLFGGNFSFLIDDGRELSQITDAKWLTITFAPDMMAERRADGLLYGCSTTVTPPVVVPPTPPVVAPPMVHAKTLVNVNTLTGDIEITPVIENGKLINLVDSNPAEQVLDASGQIIAGYRIVWNDSGSWYPLKGNESRIILPSTVFPSAAKPVGTGAGMPYLVRPDGSFVPFNTDPTVCTFTVNGVLTKINTDGLMPY